MSSASCSVVSDSLRPHGLNSPWNSPGQNNGVGSHSLLQGTFPTQGWNPGLLHRRWIFLPAEPPGKPKNTGVGSLPLLQGIFSAQESNQGLQHCRWILYQLYHQGSPSRGHAPSETCSRGSCLCLLLLMISRNPSHFLACTHISSISASVFTQPSPHISILEPPLFNRDSSPMGLGRSPP